MASKVIARFLRPYIRLREARTEAIAPSQISNMQRGYYDSIIIDRHPSTDDDSVQMWFDGGISHTEIRFCPVLRKSCQINDGHKNMVTVQLRQINVPPGQRVLLHDVSWQEFEKILEELGEHRAARLAYSQGFLEIRMPLPEHEVDKELIGDMVKILLEELNIDCECFGSTTFKRETKKGGVEPDQCFYIQNHEVMRGKRRVDLTIDPPPDLAIEIDVTSKTQLEAYEAIQVPELWRYENNSLQISILQEGTYIESQDSHTFHGLPIIQLITEEVARSTTIGRSPTLRAFRLRIRKMIQLNA